MQTTDRASLWTVRSTASIVTSQPCAENVLSVQDAVNECNTLNVASMMKTVMLPCRRTPHCRVWEEHHRRGWTLVELLVVVGVIALLLALALPAVQWSRERSRAAACQNNLKQLGTALVNFHSQVGHLPKDGKNGYGYGAFLLPQIEQTALHERLQPLTTPLASDTQARNRGGDTPLEVFRCPSFDGPPILESGSLGRSTYLASADLFSKSTQLPNVRDGLSNTIALGETVRDQAWVLPGTGSGDAPPNQGDFGSRHAAGAHFLFCEGSVRFIGDSVDSETFQALFTPAGQETLGDF